MHSRCHAKDGNIKSAAQLTGVGPFCKKVTDLGMAVSYISEILEMEDS